MGEALETSSDRAKELPAEVRIGYQGQAKEFRATERDLRHLRLALLVVFLVLAAQFESWIIPLVIMRPCRSRCRRHCSACCITGPTINIYSQIGLIMLVGLMAKNGILIVEFANQLRDEGRRCATRCIEAPRCACARSS